MFKQISAFFSSLFRKTSASDGESSGGIQATADPRKARLLDREWVREMRKETAELGTEETLPKQSGVPKSLHFVENSPRIHFKVGADLGSGTFAYTKTTEKTSPVKATKNKKATSKQKKELSVSPATFILQERLKGRTYKYIAKALNGHGSVSTSGSKWTINSVYYVANKQSAPKESNEKS